MSRSILFSTFCSRSSRICSFRYCNAIRGDLLLTALCESGTIRFSSPPNSIVASKSIVSGRCWSVFIPELNASIAHPVTHDSTLGVQAMKSIFLVPREYVAGSGFSLY